MYVLANDDADDDSDEDYEDVEDDDVRDAPFMHSHDGVVSDHVSI